MRTCTRTELAALLAALGSAILLGGCGPMSADELPQGGGSPVASTRSAITGWMDWVSDETVPGTCDSGTLIDWFECSGRYCDNMSARCQPVAGAEYASNHWTSYFSEEGTNYRVCGAYEWVTGFACTGDYCDNVSLQCSYTPNITPTGCFWTGWVSEETAFLYFGSGYYARGAQCGGSYCDNMRFYVCQKTP